MVNHVCYQVIGCDTTICAASEAGQLELNVMMPVIAWNAIHETTILREAMKSLKTRCVDGILADVDRCRELLDRSTAVATALSPYIGYAATAEIAKEAVATGRTIRELVLERRLMDARHRLRAGRAASGDRSDPSPCCEGRTEECRDAPRRGQRSASSARKSRCGARRGRLSGGRRPGHVPAESRRVAEAERSNWNRELQARQGRPRAVDAGRRRARGTRGRRGRRAGCR